MMMIDKYISELLYNHDCVIVPGLGGFIANYAHARIHPALNTFSPPSKDISFNTSLKRNDGLLVSYVAGRENLSYEKSFSKIEQFVSECWNQLKNNQEVEFHEIGKIKKDVEGNIQYFPENEINYLSESYGLTNFSSPPVKRQREIRKKENIFKDRRPEYQRITDKRTKRAAWLVLPSIVLILWVIFNVDLIRDINTNYSGIIPFLKYSISSRLEPKEITESIKPVEENFQLTEAETTTINTVVPETPVESDAEIGTIDDIKEAKNIPTPDPVENIEKEVIKKYFIIAGAFKIKRNAENLVDELISEGYEAEFVGQTPSGLHRVSYQGFADKKEALQNLDAIRNEINPHAWLFEK